MSKEWLTINELADRLKVSIKTIRNRMADGLPYHKIGGALRFDYDEVVDLGNGEFYGLCVVAVIVTGNL